MIAAIIAVSVLLVVTLWILGLFWLEDNRKSKWHFPITCLMFFPALPFIFVYAKYQNHCEQNGY